MAFFIPGNVPALKNNKKIITVYGKYKLVPSDRVQKWRRETKPIWIKNKHRFRNEAKHYDKPLRVGFFFVRTDSRIFDYTNALDTLQDEMVSHKWIDDDNMNEIIPVIEGFKVNKDQPGVYITILEPEYDDDD